MPDKDIDFRVRAHVAASFFGPTLCRYWARALVKHTMTPVEVLQEIRSVRSHVGLSR